MKENILWCELLVLIKAVSSDQVILTFLVEDVDKLVTGKPEKFLAELDN